MKFTSSVINNFALTRRQYLWKSLTLLILLTCIQPSRPQHHAMANLNEEFAKKSSVFSAKLYNEISQPNTNVIYSPFSIQACVAMARMGATGETAKEMDSGLSLVSSDVTSIADTFYNILVKYKDSPILKIANKIYVSDRYSIQKEFSDLITNKFLSAAEKINFIRNEEAVNSINQWVESKTNNLIKNLISPTVLGDLTRLVLVNAVHFKGAWRYPFLKHGTQNEDFYLTEVDTVKVPMMNLEHDLPYADLPELDATAIQMPYQNSDLSMLVILPNSRTGLQSLEQKLKTVLLTEITSKLTTKKVIIKFPKFKAEFTANLNVPLQKLGMSRMFSDNAEFSKMLESAEGLLVSNVIHKAYIDVNEQGTEAAAATGAVVRKKRSANVYAIDPIKFMADHPFFYVINHYEKPRTNDDSSTQNTISISPIPLFTGTVVTLKYAADFSNEHDEL